MPRWQPVQPALPRWCYHCRVETSTAIPAGADGALAWSFNPWMADWRRPALALAACVAVAVLFGYTVSVPNYPPEQLIAQYRQEAAPLDGNPTGAGLSPEEHARALKAQAALQQLAADPAGTRWRGEWAVWSAISLVFLLGMTLVIYTPVSYRLDARGVTVRFMGVNSFRPWEHYRNFYAHTRVVHLTTMPRPSRLDPFRGHPLQFAGNRDAVLAFLETHIAKAESRAAGA